MKDHPTVEALERDGYPTPVPTEYFIDFSGHGYAVTEDIDALEDRLRKAIDGLIEDCEMDIVTISEVG